MKPAYLVAAFCAMGAFFGVFFISTLAIDHKLHSIDESLGIIAARLNQPVHIRIENVGFDTTNHVPWYVNEKEQRQ